MPNITSGSGSHAPTTAATSDKGQVLSPVFKLNGIPCLDPSPLLRQLSASHKDAGLALLFQGKANAWVEVCGRNPSYGWLLISGTTLRSIEKNYQRPVHTLRIEDGNGRFFQRNAVCITRYIAVTSSLASASGIDNDVAYLVELADSRYYAPWSTASTEFNVRTVDAMDWKKPVAGVRTNFDFNNGPGDLDWMQVLFQMWNSTGLFDLLGPLSFHATSTFPYLGPESLKMPGVNAWESFNSIIESIGWNICPAYNITGGGYTLYGSDARPTKRENAAFATARNSALEATEGSGERGPLPEIIRVYVPSRAYGWDSTQDIHDSQTAQEFWDTFPTRHVNYPVNNLLPGHTNQVIPGAVKNVWGTIPYMTDDMGNVFAEDDLRNHMQSLAVAHAQRMRGEQHASFKFFGLWPTRVGTRFTGVAYYDFGDGMRSRWFTRPQNLNPTKLDLTGLSERKPATPSEDTQAPADTMRQQAPRTRRQRGIVFSTLNVHCYTHPIAFGAARSDNDTIAPGRWAWVLLQASKIDYTLGVQTYVSSDRFVRAFNATDDAIPFSVACEIDYVYEAGMQGEWHIINHWQQYPDVQNLCPPSKTQELDQSVWRVRRAKTINVNRQSSLRLGWPVGAQAEECTALIENSPGPRNALFQSRHPDEHPRWIYDAAIHGSLEIGTYLKFQNNEKSAWLGPPETHRQVGVRVGFRLPGNRARTGSYLVAGPVNGTCVQTEWFGPGREFVVSMNAYTGSGCTGTFRCITMNFVNGLLTQTNPSELGTLPTPRHDVTCKDYPQSDWDPCGSEQMSPNFFRPIPPVSHPDDNDQSGGQNKISNPSIT